MSKNKQNSTVKDDKGFVGKDNEEVLVVKTKLLFPDGIWEGFRSVDSNEILDLINTNSEYVKRGYCETDENYQQIIAQIILKVGKKLFIYKMAQTGGEARLHDLYPIFLGGHINKEDENIQKAFDREFEEEIDYKGKIISKKFLGLVKLHDNAVNRVHVGLVWMYEGDSEKYNDTHDDGIADGKFAGVKDLDGLKDKMTYWSKVVYPEIRDTLL